MLDLGLFRKPAFNGVSAVAFGLSARDVRDVPLPDDLHAGRARLLAAGGGPALPAADRALASSSRRSPARSPTGSRSGSCSASAWRLVGVGLLLMHGVAPDSEWTTLLAGFLVAGIGIGITNPGIGQAAIAVVPVEKSGMGSGINTTFRQVGIATGVAGARRDLPVAGRLEARPSCCRTPRTGLGELVASGGSRGGGRGRRRPAIHGGSRPRLRRRLRQRLQRDHPDRRDPLLRRRRPRLRPRPLAGTSSRRPAPRPRPPASRSQPSATATDPPRRVLHRGRAA